MATGPRGAPRPVEAYAQVNEAIRVALQHHSHNPGFRHRVPIFVPLHYRTIGSGGEKLGIYVTISGGTTPLVVEFDTGSAGLYAAYASADTNKSKWWGTDFNFTGQFVTNTYESGIRYEGAIVTAPVSFYAEHNSTEALITTADNLRGGFLPETQGECWESVAVAAAR